ncbi:MAG: hypothetical protein ACE37M_13010 [Henriciella sp.]
MYSLLTALHTKQVWLGILALSAWVLLHAARPINSEALAGTSVTNIADRVELNRGSDLNDAMQKLTRSGFYVPVVVDDPSVTQAIDIAGAEAAAVPTLRLTRSLNGRWAAYFGTGEQRIIVEENDDIHGWVVSDIGPASVQLTNETESRRIYIFDRLPDANSEDSQL